MASEVSKYVRKACWGAVLGSDVSNQERQVAVPGNEDLLALHFHHSPKAVWTQEGIISFDFKEIAKD